jgi:DnaK suppressor protein
VTPSLRKKLEQALTALRDELLAAGPAKIEPNRSDPATVGTSDEDAQALSEMLQTLASQRNKQSKERLARIQRSLRKLAESPDDYGLCESCEEEIPEKRLLAMPDAPLCAECQAKEDPKRGGSRKSLTDYR